MVCSVFFASHLGYDFMVLGGGGEILSIFAISFYLSLLFHRLLFGRPPPSIKFTVRVRVRVKVKVGVRV
jgi:hypothetical protein